jgi:hypothetical protein
MTEINSLLLEFTRREKLPPDYLSQRNARMASVMLRGALGLKPEKATSVGAIAAATGKSYNEVLSDTLEQLQSCRQVVEADPETYRPETLKTLDHMIASTKEAQDHKY